ncbi:MAG: RsmF rRNA methyltransferase first C-terminal domain-containing protein [Lachnospiraceae bacterium]|nr:RsmF rRNA methyltransferase first C-terminal domain-containing protein [Lachnospiraceae bacterium]
MISLPEQFKKRMERMLADEYDGFIESYDEPAVRSVRISMMRTRGKDIEKLASYITGMPAPEEVSWCPNAFYYTDDAAPGKLALHDAGVFYIQEASAMYPVTVLGIDGSGLKVLDLCAAPGGKTTQIADLMDSSGLLVANEIIPSRADILSENVERMGASNVLVVNEDPMALAKRFPAYFDRILVDAPCSGEGMFRKNPEAVNEWSPENVKMCAKRQKMLLTCASSMLAEGGRIVYCTCTFSPEEDEGAIESFLAENPGFALAGQHRLYPHTHRGEGHFAAVLCRASDLSSAAGCSGRASGPISDSARKKGGFSPKGGRKQFDDALLRSFLEDTLRPGSTVRQTIENCQERLISFGDSLYLAPAAMPDISGLKIKRAGLKLGTFKKNRFEPDHALSHVLGPDDVYNCIDLDPDGDEIRNYLSGLTISCSADIRGWCLIAAGSFGTGWGKASSSTVRNHYPAGIRRRAFR